MYLYIHGFNSSPQSVKAQQLQSALKARGRGAEFVCPALSYDPKTAMHQLESLIANVQPLVLVGSSLGGFYATYLAERHECKAVLVNPAITPHLGLRDYLGAQRNLYTGDVYELTEQHLRDMAAYYVARPTHAERLFLMVTTGDEVLDYREAVQHYQGARHLVVQGSDHGFAQFDHYIDQVLEFGG